MTGVNLQTSFTNIQRMMLNELRSESNMSYVGGNSTVLLFLLNSGTIENNQNVFQAARLVNDTVPGNVHISYALSPKR
jgi:hypothetical protein